jgi:hypothetical protein
MFQSLDINIIASAFFPSPLPATTSTTMHAFLSSKAQNR